MLLIVAVGLVAPENGPIRLRAERSKDKPELQILISIIHISSPVLIFF